MPTRLGEFTTVSTSNFYFYPSPGSSSTPQGYLLATGPTGFIVPQNPNVLTSTIIGSGYLDSSISTALSATTACLAQTSTLNTYVSINTASISSQGQQISTISTNLQGLSNFVVANIGATPYLSTQVSDLTAGYSSLVYGFSSLSTFVGGQATKLQAVSDSLSANILNVSSLSTTVSSLVVANSSLSFNFSSLSSFVNSYAAFTCTISDSLSANIYNVSSLSSVVSAQVTLLSSTAASLCTTIEILSSVSSVVAGLAAGTVTVGDFTALSTYTSSLGASVGFLTLDVSSLALNVSTLSTNVSSLQSTTTYLLNNSLTSAGVLSLLSSQNNVYFGSNIQVSSVASNLYFNAGRVGIGCNTPASNFVVEGTSMFTGAMNISSVLTVRSNASFNRNASTLLNVDATSFKVFIGNTITSSDTVLNVNGSGYFYGGIFAARQSQFQSTVNIYNGDFGVNTSTLYVSSGAGRVGIGCNTPVTTLDVNGTLQIRGNATFFSTVKVEKELQVSSLLYVTSNVGIGCNLPIYDLDVRGSTHTYKLDVDYANVFQSTPTQVLGADVQYIFSTIALNGFLFPSTVILTKTTDVFNQYSQVMVTYGVSANSTAFFGNNFYGMFQLSTNSYLHSNQYVVGPFGNAETRRLDVTTVLRRGYDYSSNDTQLELILINSATASYFLSHFGIVGIY